MKCKSCGADCPAGITTCRYCGAEVERKRPQGREAVFREILNSAVYARRESPQRLAALPKLPTIAKIIPLFVIGAFILVPVFGLVITLSVAGGFAAFGGSFGGEMSLIPLAMGICPLAFIGLGIAMGVMFFRKMRHFDESPVVARAVLITSKRMSVTGGSGDCSASTNYFVTAEFEDGSREEFQAMTPQFYSQLAEHDAGVLFTRATVAVDFDRVV
jgi:hypothetical protein